MGLKGRQARNPKEYVLAAFAEVFPTLTVSELRHLAGVPAGEDEPWVPPDEVHRLSGRQKRALEELIRSIAADTEVGDGDERDAAPMIWSTTGPGKSAAFARRGEELREIQKKAARDE